MSKETVARRYSLALADTLSDPDDIKAVSTELAMWADILRSNPELAELFSSPAVQQAEKEKLLETLIAKSRPTKTTANFVRVLLKNGRLAEISSILEHFKGVLGIRSGVVAVKIISARELQEQERAEFEKNLEKLTASKVSVKFDIDSDIIGGVVTRIGSTVYDDSVRSKLVDLREKLING